MAAIAGLDYSLTCPCICVATDFDYKVFYLTNTKKAVGVTDLTTFLITGYTHCIYSNDQQRYDNISRCFMRIISDLNVSQVFLEGYSMGSKGRVFNLAENMGLMKHKLWMSHTQYFEIPPTVIKKYATGKGNANKLKMYEAFKNNTGINLMKELGYKTLSNPITDIVDSFFICKYGIENY